MSEPERLDSLPWPPVISVVRSAVEEAREHYEYFDKSHQDHYDEENKYEVAHQIKGLRHVETYTHCTFIILSKINSWQLFECN